MEEKNNRLMNEYLDKEKISLHPPMTTPQSTEGWEREFDLIWGEAPDESLKFYKGKAIKDFIRQEREALLKEIVEKVEKIQSNFETYGIKKQWEITDEYGQLHESNCDLNTEDGSYEGCDCAMKSLSDEVVSRLIEYFSYDIFDNEKQRKAGVDLYRESFGLKK